MSSKSFRQRMSEILDHQYFHRAIVVLTILDLFLILGEIIIHQEYCGVEEIPLEIERTSKAFGYLGLSILAFFAVEILVQVLVSGLKFFYSVPHVIEFIIIYVSLVFESLNHSKLANEVVSLLIIFRLWRLVRVIHETKEATENAYEIKIQHMESRIKELETELRLKKYI